MSGFISYPYAVSVVAGGGGTVGGEFLAGETDAMGVDFTYHTDITKQLYISDLTTPANNYNGTAQGKLTYTSPSAKLCRQSDGVWRYGNHNLCLQSQTLDNASWTKTSTAISANTADTTSPDGTSTADKNTESASGALLTSATITIGTGAQIVSVFAKKGNHDWLRLFVSDNIVASGCRAWFDLNNGVTGSTTNFGSGWTAGTIAIASAGNGWYRCSLNFVSTGSTLQVNLLSASADAATTRADIGGGAGVGTIFYAWGVQAKRYPVTDAGGFTAATGYLATTSSAVYDLPYEWDSALASQGILIEEARTNLVLRSQELDNVGTWSGIALTGVTANATTAPDGTTTAEKIIPSAASSGHSLVVSGLTTVANNTFTCFLKAAGMNFVELAITSAGFANYAARTFNLNTGTLGNTRASTYTLVSSSIVDAGNGWYKCSVTANPGSGSDGNIWISVNSVDSFSVAWTGNASDGAYAWGAQFEAGAFPTSPIHTIGATVTRAVDNISILTSAIPFSNTVGAMVANIMPNDINVAWYWQLAGSPPSDERQGIHSNVNFFVMDGGVSQGNIDGGNLTVGVASRIGTAWQSNDLAIVVDGAAAVTDASATLPTVTNLRIGGGLDPAGAGNCYVRQLTYLKRRATNAELQTRTT